MGGLVSPTLSNLFLHYVFDAWMARNYPGIPFERYADDVICHCRSAKEAQALWSSLEARFTACKLTLFLGYAFRPREAIWHGNQHAVAFLPAASPKALKAIRQTIRRWALHRRSDLTLADLAQEYNPYLRGWVNYYSHFYRSALHPTLRCVDAHLIRWARNKYKRLRPRPKGARDWLARIHRANPALFAHWRVLHVNGRTSGAV